MDCQPLFRRKDAEVQHGDLREYVAYSMLRVRAMNTLRLLTGGGLHNKHTSEYLAVMAVRSFKNGDNEERSYSYSHEAFDSYEALFGYSQKEPEIYKRGIRKRLKIYERRLIK